jgi:hypothetical protein
MASWTSRLPDIVSLIAMGRSLTPSNSFVYPCLPPPTQLSPAISRGDESRCGKARFSFAGVDDGNPTTREWPSQAPGSNKLRFSPGRHHELAVVRHTYAFIASAPQTLLRSHVPLIRPASTIGRRSRWRSHHRITLEPYSNRAIGAAAYKAVFGTSDSPRFCMAQATPPPADDDGT